MNILKKSSSNKFDMSKLGWIGVLASGMRRRRSNKFTINKFGWIGGLGIGAGLMYILDPAMGRRRRAVTRDKVIRFGHKTADAIDASARDVQNRGYGLLAVSKRMFSQPELSDSVLEDRVRAELGFLVSHPSAIDVAVSDGTVKLSGPILKHEVDRLLKRVVRMRGVKNVENRLEVHETADSVPGLQGEPSERTGRRLDIFQRHWSPATRVLAGGAAGASLAYAARRGDLVGVAVALIGGGLLSRALTNIEFKRLIGVGAGPRGIDIKKSIQIAATVEEVFTFWSNYENFPRFMSNVREVKKIGDDRSHWVVAGPGGVPVEWDAIVTNYVPNQSIGWETVPGSPVQHAGLVRFERNEDGPTTLHIRISYNPVAGSLGHVVASLFGADPKSRMDEDLMRMKSMIETGVKPHDAARKDESEDYVH